jgi:hypothetical protein
MDPKWPQESESFVYSEICDRHEQIGMTLQFKEDASSRTVSYDIFIQYIHFL